MTIEIDETTLKELKRAVKLLMESTGYPVYKPEAKRISYKMEFYSGEGCPVYNRRDGGRTCPRCKGCKFASKSIGDIIIPDRLILKGANIKEAEFENLFGEEAACWLEICDGVLHRIPMLGIGERRPWWKKTEKTSKPRKKDLWEL